MNGEAPCIDTQAHGVADERERHKRQQARQYQQNKADFLQERVDTFHQTFLIGDITHLGITLQFLGNPFQRIVVGIVTFELNLYGSIKRFVAYKLLRICPQSLFLLINSLLINY